MPKNLYRPDRLVLYLGIKRRLFKALKMKNKAPLILAALMLLWLSSCYYDELIEVEIPDIPDTQEISFSADIEPLFSQAGKDCTRCHDANTSPDLRVGNAYDALVPEYVSAGNPDGSELYQKLPGVGHPFDVGFNLDASEISLIREWIERGAENN
ncbi:MAG: hypothetical protein KJO94_08945 [Eudoraea sp.]|nr:hypothetical protein [Eudoraea sp.]